jgi:hypothetical protein
MRWLFGLRKAALAVAEVRQGWVRMMRNDRIHVGLDAARLQIFDEPVAIGVQP